MRGYGSTPRRSIRCRSVDRVPRTPSRRCFFRGNRCFRSSAATATTRPALPQSFAPAGSWRSKATDRCNSTTRAGAVLAARSALRVVPGSGGRTVVRLAYARVLAVDNGYHSLRTALSRRLTPVLSGTLEAYAYLYDEPIRGRTSSEVYSGTLGYELTEQMKLLWGASLAQSPYAELDAQTLVRLELDFDFGTRSARRMTRLPSSLPLALLVLGCDLGRGARSLRRSQAQPRFPHRVHLAELDCGKPGKPDCLSCNSCHAVSERDRAHKLPNSRALRGLPSRRRSRDPRRARHQTAARVRRRSTSTTTST